MINMLERYELDQLCKDLEINENGKKLIENIRKSPPSRAVGGGRSNVTGRYPSQKMGVTIQFESHRVELAAIYRMEYDDSVLEYYDQPPPIKLNYASRNGRNIGVMTTPDFFVIERDAIAWEEWKTEKDLLKLSMKSPNRYIRTDNGVWVCPPGEGYAKQYGLQYRLRSSDEICWEFQRNVMFLEDYILHADHTVDNEAKRLITSLVGQEPGILLSELLANKTNYTSDDIYYLLAQKHLYFAINKHVLAEPGTVKIFLNEEQAKAYENIITYNKRPIFSLNVLDVQVGSEIIWDGKIWTIINNGMEYVSLLSSDGQALDLPKDLLAKYVNNNTIKGLNKEKTNEENPEVKKILHSADEKDLEIANTRFEFVQRAINNEPVDSSEVSPRTLRDWVKQYREAEEAFGNGYVGLIPRMKNRGNRAQKLPDESIELMNDYINNNYETIKQKSRKIVYGQLANECESTGILPPSYQTFCLAVKNRPKAEQTRKRKGNRAAYQVGEFYWELSQTTPRHGDRPFEICHIDHTEAPIEFVSSVTGRNLGKAWLTILADAFSRYILAHLLIFDPPSYRTNMMLLRECVRRYNRLPQTIVTDGGKDFQSAYYEALLARYHITKKTRPPAKPRFGSVVERSFGTVETMFFDNLQGNTQIMKNVREVTKSVYPKNNAIWTLGALDERLEQWVHGVYHKQEHPALGQSPEEAFQLGLERSGVRPYRLIPYNNNFIIMTLPTTKNGEAKVQPSRGAKINYINYWNEAMKNPLVEGIKVPVRFDPYNIGIAYTYIRNEWLLCKSGYYSMFKNVTEKELRLITEQIRQKDKNHAKSVTINAKRIANFISLMEEDEKIMLQRAKDHESRQVLRLINPAQEENNAISSEEINANYSEDVNPDAKYPDKEGQDTFSGFEEEFNL